MGMADEFRVPKPHQEWDQGLIGRDPRRMTVEELRASGVGGMPLLAVIRVKCPESMCGGSLHLSCAGT
jgi:hypothetical protein